MPTGPPTIGVVATRVETDYRVTHVTRTNESYDLTLEPKRDPRRNRIDELWIDPATFEIQRARVRDHVYFNMGGAKDEELDVQFVVRDGLPIIASIHGETEDGDEPRRRPDRSERHERRGVRRHDARVLETDEGEEHADARGHGDLQVLRNRAHDRLPNAE